MSTAISDARAEAMAKIRASQLRSAGLVGEYARADCELGHRLYELAKERVRAYVHGESGRGKTYAASCAVRMWSDSGGKARLVSAPRLMEESTRASRGTATSTRSTGRAASRFSPWMTSVWRGRPRPPSRSSPSWSTSGSRPGCRPSSPATCESGCSELMGRGPRQALGIEGHRLLPNRGARGRGLEGQVQTMSQLRGLSLERAELFGKPHIGARYTHGARYERTGSGAASAIDQPPTATTSRRGGSASGSPS